MRAVGVGELHWLVLVLASFSVHHPVSTLLLVIIDQALV